MRNLLFLLFFLIISCKTEHIFIQKVEIIRENRIPTPDVLKVYFTASEEMISKVKDDKILSVSYKFGDYLNQKETSEFPKIIVSQDSLIYIQSTSMYKRYDSISFEKVKKYIQQNIELYIEDNNGSVYHIKKKPR